MQVDDIKALMEAMRQNGLNMLEWENEGSRIKLKRNSFAAAAGTICQPDATIQEADKENAGSSLQDLEASDDLITAPVVGIYYAAPAPDSDPFVQVGSAVDTGTTLCIIEAMKLMNEVTSSRAGIVREILVEDGQKVEFGQPLMRLGGNNDAT